MEFGTMSTLSGGRLRHNALHILEESSLNHTT
jgi:hypothetical protein